MPHVSLRQLVTACVLSSAVLAGCQTSTPRPVSRPVSKVVLVSAAPEVSDASWCGASLEPSSKNLAKGDVAVAVGPKTQVRTVAQKVEQTTDASPAVPKMPKLPPVPVPVPLPLPPLPPPPPPPTVLAKDAVPPAPRAAPATPRKSDSDITPHSNYGHAPDYAWISGEVQKWRHEWRLRYAAVDEVDPHGGSVTLAGEQHLDKLKEGEHYKLRGRLVPSDSKNAGPVFYIDRVQPVGS